MSSLLKKSFSRGFTLIELMIVIVILGVLMGTILPRLTGAQARARDTGRVADLNTLSQALETHYDDFGEYPGVMGTVNCLDGSDVVSNALEGYLKGGIIPQAPSTDQTTKVGDKSCGSGNYLYAPLINRGLENNGFILATDMETYQNANFDGSSSTTIDVNSEVIDFVPVDGVSLKALEEDVGGVAADALKTIYILVQ